MRGSPDLSSGSANHLLSLDDLGSKTSRQMASKYWAHFGRRGYTSKLYSYCYPTSRHGQLWSPCSRSAEMCGRSTSPSFPSLPGLFFLTALGHREGRCGRNSSLLSLLKGPLPLGLRLLEGDSDLAMLRIVFLPFPDGALGRGGMGFCQRFSPGRVASPCSPPVGVGVFVTVCLCLGRSVCICAFVCAHLSVCPGVYMYTCACLRVGLC